MRDQTTADVRADVSGTSTNGEKVHAVDGCSGCDQALLDRETPDLDCSSKVTGIQLIGCFSLIERAFQIEMTILNITVEKYVANTRAVVAGCVEAFLLSDPQGRVCCADTDDSRKGHE